MYEVGRIQDYQVDESGTTLKVFLPGKNYLEYLTGKHVKNCGLWIEDGRHITAEQRKKLYAMFADISACTGFLPEEQKEQCKYYFMIKTGNPYPHLSNCSIDTASALLETTLDYAIENGYELHELLADRAENIDQALYSCLKHRKCAVCGRDGEIHHVDTIGMGNDRRRVDDSGFRKICLCRKHHSEAHTIGMQEFEKRYKVYGIIYRD